MEVCPVDCIHDDGDEQMILDDPPGEHRLRHTEPACPVTAIFAGDDVPAAGKAYIEVSRLQPRAGADGVMAASYGPAGRCCLATILAERPGEGVSLIRTSVCSTVEEELQP